MENLKNLLVYVVFFCSIPKIANFVELRFAISPSIDISFQKNECILTLPIPIFTCSNILS